MLIEFGKYLFFLFEGTIQIRYTITLIQLVFDRRF
jgi:hypothetical protein